MKPDGPVARRRDYRVQPIPHAEGAEFIRKHHYARGCSNTSVFCHGMFRGPTLVGVAMWLPPTKACALSVHAEWRRVLSLTRVAVAETEPQNAESILVGASLRYVREDPRWVALVTYADSRKGHAGTIYRATNWTYVGETKPSPCWLDFDGKQVARKAGRTRTNEEMRQLGYAYVGAFKKHKFVMYLGDTTATPPPSPAVTTSTPAPAQGTEDRT